MGRLPRHVHRPVRHLGRREHRAGEEELRADADRALPARLALRLLRHLGVGSDRPRRADRRRGRIRRRAGAPAARLELGLPLDDHGQGPVHRRRRRGRLRPQVLLRLARRRPPRRQGDGQVRARQQGLEARARHARPTQLAEEIYKPVRTFLEHKDYTTAIDINPHYITPKMLQFRLQKIMDEYVAGVATYYNTNDKMLEGGRREARDAEGRRAEDARQGPARAAARLGELPPHPHRRSAHEAHPVPRGDPATRASTTAPTRTSSTRRTGTASSTRSTTRTTKKWTCFKRKHVDLVDKSKLFKAAAH